MMFQSVFCFCLWCCILSGSEATVNITICTMIVKGTLIPFHYTRSQAAVDIALEKLPGILGPDVNVEYLYRDFHDDCTQNFVGSIAADVYFHNNVTVFIGPGCSDSTKVVGRLAASWNLPIISPVATNGDLGNKDDFKTLTRLAYNMNKFANFYLKTLEHFGWDDIAIIHGMAYTLFRIVGDSLEPAFEDVGKRVIRQKLTTYDDDTLERYLLKASQYSRVIVLSCYGDDLRKIMLTAEKLGMTSGEYVFIYLRLFKGDSLGDTTWIRNDADDERAKKAYEAVLIMQPRRPDNENFLQFEREVKERSLRDYNFTYGEFEVNIFIRAFHDAFIIYANVLKDMIANGENFMDGKLVSSKIWNHTFEGIGGPMIIDESGDRETDFSMLDLDPVTGEYVVVAEYLGIYRNLTFSNERPIHWPSNYGPPPNVPRCGFMGDDPACEVATDSTTTPLIAGLVAGFVIVLGLVVFLGYRKMKLESDLTSQWWRVKWEDVSQVHGGSTRGSSRLSIETTSMRESPEKDVAQYKGSSVVIQSLNVKTVKLSRQALLELRLMRDIPCPNLTRFYGLSVEHPHVCVLTEHCVRGSLRDMVQNESIKLDLDFKLSLMNDIIEGMNYIHSSALFTHGRLNSDNCLIDGRFVLKLTNFGIPEIRSQEHKNDDFNKHVLLWVAPEHLRQDAVHSVSQPGDVYSFAIVLSEMFTRNEPFEEYLEDSSIDDVIEKIKSQGGLRPQLQLEGVDEIRALIIDCWSEKSADRPPFSMIKKRHKKISGNSGGRHILDTLLQRMEQYANNLEGLVEERTRAFLEEKKRSEELLYQVLPRSVADKLRMGQSVDAEAYDSVSIYFSDIVGFTAISADSTAMQVVDLLNTLYTIFDGIIDHYDVYKVETIGDAYMVVSGLPVRNGNEHVRQISRMALSIRESLKQIKIAHLPDRTLMARIGLHTGPVCAGVVGRKMPRYCLFGDTVNTASRMESNGEAMKIHMSESAMLALQQFGSFILESRGEIPIKGKGLMETFWLVAEKPGFHKHLPPLQAQL